MPLLIRAPWLDGGGGSRTDAIVEIVSVMPTLIELAGLPPSTEQLGGSSFAAIVAAAGGTERGTPPPALAEPRYAFTTFPRCNCTYSTDQIGVRNGTCPMDMPYRGYPAGSGGLVAGALSASNMHVCLETTGATTTMLLILFFFTRSSV